MTEFINNNVVLSIITQGGFMCKFCNDKNRFDYLNVGICLSDENILRIFDNTDVNIDVPMPLSYKINYCQFCGEFLKGS